jgi:hypothetical protein
LRAFHTDVAKVDPEVAYSMLQASVLMFHLIYRLCCKRVIWVYMFHTYVASVLSGRCVCFAMVSKCFSGVFCKCFRYMF